MANIPCLSDERSQRKLHKSIKPWLKKNSDYCVLKSAYRPRLLNGFFVGRRFGDFFLMGLSQIALNSFSFGIMITIFPFFNWYFMFNHEQKSCWWVCRLNRPVNWMTSVYFLYIFYFFFLFWHHDFTKENFSNHNDLMT